MEINRHKKIKNKYFCRSAFRLVIW